MFGKIPVLKISEDSQKNIFGKVLFKQFKLSNLSSITILKTDSITNVSFECFFKIAMRASCGETTSKVACEISAFYDFVKNSITLSLVCFEN